MFDFYKIQMRHKIHTGFLRISIISWHFRQGFYSPMGYKFSKRQRERGLSDNCERHAYLAFWNQCFLNFDKFEYENENNIENIFRLLRLIRKDITASLEKSEPYLKLYYQNKCDSTSEIASLNSLHALSDPDNLNLWCSYILNDEIKWIECYDLCHYINSLSQIAV